MLSGTIPSETMMVRCTGRIQGATAVHKNGMEASSPLNSSRSGPVSCKTAEGNLETPAKVVQYLRNGLDENARGCQGEGPQLQVATSSCNFRLQLQVATSGCNFRLQHQVATSGCNSRLQLQVATSGCNIRLQLMLQLQVPTSGCNFRCNFKLQLQVATSGCNFKLQLQVAT